MAATAFESDRWNDLATSILAGGSPTGEDALAVLRTDDVDVPGLLAAAYRIRHRHFGNVVKLNYLVNAKSGACPEDCAYCSQSIVSGAKIDRYPLMSVREIEAAADRAVALRASTCCIVLSGRGANHHEVGRVTTAVARIKENHPGLKVCACMGILGPDQAEQLLASGVDRYNHNLNTSAGQYGAICSTHDYADRVETVEVAKSAGISPCSGMIVGMGESDADLVELAFALRELGADSIPVNFLVPIAGTPLANPPETLTPRRCLKVLCMLRFACPDREIRVSAGREGHLRTLQPMSLYPANAIFVADYLTTEGQSPRLDWQIIEDLGFEIEGGFPTASAPAMGRRRT